MFCISRLAFYYTVVIENIKNMYAVSTNQIAVILHYNDKITYVFLSSFGIECVLWKYLKTVSSLSIGTIFQQGGDLRYSFGFLNSLKHF